MIGPIALTCGDTSGVGIEISLKAWQAMREGPVFFLIGDRNHVQHASGSCPIAEISEPAEAAAAFGAGLPLLHHDFPALMTPGVAAPQNAAAVVAVIERAVNLVDQGHASAICTNPIHKKILQDGAGFTHPGHTEFLAHLGGVSTSVMMLGAPELKVVPVTIHIALSDVPAALTEALLERTIRITHQAMQSDFGIEKPRLAIAGLNPHAGEGGAMGSEEITLISPLLKRLRHEGLNLSGPHSGDTMFHEEARKNYDIAICMYHDQALIPIKTLNFSAGVNTTLGLPFVRTSPDHGTAFDIAGKGLADPTSLIEALKLAARMAENRMKT